MQRRKFIRTSLTGLPIALLAPHLLVSCSKEEPGNTGTGKTVVIVGAGMAGLAAARLLTDRGFSVKIVESQEKPGGRIKTNNGLGVPFDEGASWIHGPNNNPISFLANQAGAATFLTDDDNLSVFDISGSLYSSNAITNAEAQYNSALGTVRGNGSLNESFKQVFNARYPGRENERLWQYILSSYLEFDTGADISQLSSLYFDDDESFAGDDVIITNGFEKVINYMARGLDISINTPVTAIDYNSAKVNVTTASGNINADYVLVTVPLGVLKNNRINFTPALPADKIAAITKTKMGNVNKFLLQWNSAFWDANVQYIGYTAETKGKFNYFLNLKKFTPANALMTFAFGDYATQTESMTDEGIIAAIMEHLRNIYGSSTPSPTGFLRTRWGQNQHSFGAYSFATNSTTPDDFDSMAISVNNKVFFAGEHTNRQYRGTVHGAYLSGIREAEKIIRL